MKAENEGKKLSDTVESFKVSADDIEFIKNWDEFCEKHHSEMIDFPTWEDSDESRD